MISAFEPQHVGELGLDNFAAGLRSVRHALHRVAGLLDPWPGYAVPPDELMAMLAKERQGKEQRRAGFDELLERHRRLLAEPVRNALCGEWRA